jgi:hypothetical protein
MVYNTPPSILIYSLPAIFSRYRHFSRKSQCVVAIWHVMGPIVRIVDIHELSCLCPGYGQHWPSDFKMPVVVKGKVGFRGIAQQMNESRCWQVMSPAQFANEMEVGGIRVDTDYTWEQFAKNPTRRTSTGIQYDGMGILNPIGKMDQAFKTGGHTIRLPAVITEPEKFGRS